MSKDPNKSKNLNKLATDINNIEESNEETFYAIWENIKKRVGSDFSDSSIDKIDETVILDDRPEDFFWKIVLIGDGAVGKTSIRKRYLGENFSGNYQMTIGADFAVNEDTIGWKKVKFVIWDLAGQPRFHEIRRSFYRGCQGALVVFDLTNKNSFDNLGHWINEVWKNSPKGPIPFVIVGNKADLRQMGISSIANNLVEEITTNISQETHKKFGFGTKSVITSAKTGENIREAFRLLAIQIIAHSRYFEKTRVIQ